MSSNALKRILRKDIKEIDNQKLNELGIYVEFSEENMLEAKAMITGPKGSLYENAFLFFIIKFPNNYPYVPPDVSYISRNNVRIHPNLYVGRHKSGYGKVCLSIIGTWSGPKWSSIMDITTILLTIQSLLDSNPLHHEPGQENNYSVMNDLYNEVIKYESINTLLLKNYLDPPTGFERFKGNMEKEIKKINQLKMIEYIQSLVNQDKVINIPIYRIHLNISYNNLLNKVIQLFEN
tara:strand:- start:1065 stop:1769 length:705 start_codon:yes stop_codon:yes gene_type:complete